MNGGVITFASRERGFLSFFLWSFRLSPLWNVLSHVLENDKEKVNSHARKHQNCTSSESSYMMPSKEKCLFISLQTFFFLFESELNSPNSDTRKALQSVLKTISQSSGWQSTYWTRKLPNEHSILLVRIGNLYYEVIWKQDKSLTTTKIMIDHNLVLRK